MPERRPASLAPETAEMRPRVVEWGQATSAPTFDSEAVTFDSETVTWDSDG